MTLEQKKWLRKLMRQRSGSSKRSIILTNLSQDWQRNKDIKWKIENTMNNSTDINLKS